MFFKKNRSNYERQKNIEAKKSYDNIMELADIYTSQGTIQEKFLLLDYLINSLLEDICSSVIVEPLIKTVNGILPEPFPRYFYDKTDSLQSIDTNKKVCINLSETRIYVRTWSNEKSAQNLKRLSKTDFSYKKNNHFSDFYTDINLCYVYNGNHSINAGRYLKKGEIYSNELDLTKLYPNCKTDGLYWYNTYSGKILDNAVDFRFAAVYSLAQIRYDIKKHKHN